MCGIFGYLGKKNSSKICIEGLRALEYRGYDSSGIAGVFQGKIESVKKVGDLNELADELSKVPLELEAAIAHTRWATHGKASVDNAHPHFDQDMSCAIVHNGIIENHREIKQMLTSKGYHFYSDTDSEVIAKLIGYHYQGDLLKAVSRTLKELKGLWAIACIHKDHPETMIVASHDTPLAVAVSDDETFISSDANAFTEAAKKLVFIKSHQIARLEAGLIETYDYDLNPQAPTEEAFNPQILTLSKMGFKHYMQKEIFEQPTSLNATLENRIIDGELNLFELKNLESFIKNASRVVFIGCGTSWHAGLQASYLLEKTTSLPTSAIIASELRFNEIKYPKDTLFIAISQSGETMDTLSCVKDLLAIGHTVMCLTNVAKSSLTKICIATLLLNAGPEISVCSTKAFTSQLALASLVSLKIAQIKGFQVDPNLIDAFKQIPDIAKQVLLQKDAIFEVAQKLYHFNDFFFIGRQDMYLTALESALKLKEISYAQAQAYPAGELKHGPIALISENMLTVALCGHSGTFEKTCSNLMEIHARSGPLLVFSSKDIETLKEITPYVIRLPETHDSIAPVPYAIACQLLAYFIADFKGCPIDKPKNLAKSVTVE